MACKKCGYNNVPESKWPSLAGNKHCPLCYTPKNIKFKKEVSEFGEKLLSVIGKSISNKGVNHE